MLEVFAYKAYKKHQLTKKLREQNAKEALSKKDEEFIRRSIEGGSTTTGGNKQSGQSMFKFLNSGKKKSATGDVATPTGEEFAAVKSEDEGMVTWRHWTDMAGTATPTTQEAELQRALAALNLAVEKGLPLKKCF
jgi:hypothetical protein